MTQPKEVHICFAPNGHVSSTDCWCEPVTIYHYLNDHGILLKVVEHDDAEPVTMHHSGVIFARNQVEDWITRVFDDRSL